VLIMGLVELSTIFYLFYVFYLNKFILPVHM